jgi:hypothetical protein
MLARVSRPEDRARIMCVSQLLNQAGCVPECWRAHQFLAAFPVELERVPSYAVDLSLLGTDTISALFQHCRFFQLESLYLSMAFFQLPWQLLPVSLVKLEVLACDSRSLAGLERLTGLQQLQLRSMKHITGAQQLSHLTGLTQLHLEGLRNLRSVSFASALTQLRDLKVDRNDHVDSLDCLSALTGLTELTVARLKQLGSFSVAHLQQLVRLEVSDNRVLTEVTGLGPFHAAMTQRRLGFHSMLLVVCNPLLMDDVAIMLFGHWA